MASVADHERWWAALLFGQMLVVLLLIASWLMRACAPVAPAISLSALDASVPPAPPSAPDPTPSLQASFDDARAHEKILRVELAALQDDLKEKVEQCKPEQPPLPAERWAKGDLGTLRGCWVLGRDVPMLHSFGEGKTERVIVKAGRICFDDQGSGLHEQTMVGPTTTWNCKAPMTAKFWSNGTLVAKQPDVFCEGTPPARWTATQLTCRRVTDETALCQAVDKTGRTQVEFRRAP